MYHVSIELQKHEWKFGTTGNAVGTQAEGKCSTALLSCPKLSRAFQLSNQIISLRSLSHDSRQGHRLSHMEIEGEQSYCFSINLLVIQNFIQILLTDTSKMPISSSNFVNKCTLLRYINIYHRIDSEQHSHGAKFQFP